MYYIKNTDNMCREFMNFLLNQTTVNKSRDLSIQLFNTRFLDPQCPDFYKSKLLLHDDDIY